MYTYVVTNKGRGGEQSYRVLVLSLRPSLFCLDGAVVTYVVTNKGGKAELPGAGTVTVPLSSYT